MPFSQHSRRKRISSSKHLLPLAALAGLVVIGISAFVSYQYFQAQQIAEFKKEKIAAGYIHDQVPLIDEDQTATASSLLSPSSQTASPSAMHVPILMYHYVEHVKDPGDTLRQKLAIFPETLDSQLKTMQQAGYTFMYMSDLADVIDGKKTLPPKPIVLTFDDGYRDFYTDAFPILKKYNIKSTEYIISAFIGKPNYMFLPQLQTIKQSDLVEIGAHTEHHIDLRSANEKKATEEIAGSKAALEKLFGDPVLTFAYPSGFFTDATVQIVKDAGFTSAVSTKPGTAVTPDNRLTLFRLRAGSRTGKSLLEFLQKMTQ